MGQLPVVSFEFLVGGTRDVRRGARDRVPAGWVGVFRVGRWSRVPRRAPPLWIPVFTGMTEAPTRDRPYGEEGGHKGSPLRFHPCGEDADASRVFGGVARGDGRRFPPRAPPLAPTRDRPYGEEGGHKGSPLRFHPCGEDADASRVFGGVARGGGRRFPPPRPAPGAHKGSPLRGTAWRPQGIALRSDVRMGRRRWATLVWRLVGDVCSGDVPNRMGSLIAWEA